MTRRTVIFDASVFGIEGEFLVTVYDSSCTIAHRAPEQRTWGPPNIGRETT